MRAFSIIEIVIAISIFVLIAGAGVGSYFRYYKNAIVNTNVDDAITLMKNTRFKALKNATTEDYGIYIDQSTNSLISFKKSYAPNDPENIVLKLDQLNVLSLSLQPSIGTTNSILFERQTGKTQNTGDFIIGSSLSSYKISINNQGVIDITNP